MTALHRDTMRALRGHGSTTGYVLTYDGARWKAAPNDSATHASVGLQSTAVGTSSSAGEGSVAVGVNATAPSSTGSFYNTVVGAEASVSGGKAGSAAIGHHVTVNGNDALGIGDDITVTGDRAIGIGADNSTANTAIMRTSELWLYNPGIGSPGATLRLQTSEFSTHVLGINSSGQVTVDGSAVTGSGSPGSYTDEQVRDVVGATLVAGTGMTVTVDDPGNTITLASTGGYTDEMARDAIGTALVAGTGVTITVNDPADTITISATGGGGGGGAVAVVTASRTAGDLSATATSYTAFDTATDLTIAAATGDRIELTFGLILGPSGSGNTNLNWTAKTRVSGADVNNIAGSGTASVTPWFAPDALTTVGGSYVYTVQSGDVSGGTVTFRLYYRCDNTTGRTLFANSTNPMVWHAKNLLH